MPANFVILPKSNVQHCAMFRDKVSPSSLVSKSSYAEDIETPSREIGNCEM